MNNSQARVEEVFAEAARLFRSKNATYKDSWRMQGWRGNLSRILEKSGRLKAMLWRGGPVLLSGSKEHPRETLLDIINTASFLIINMDDGIEWGVEENTLPILAPQQWSELDDFRLSYGHPEATLEEMIAANEAGRREEQTELLPKDEQLQPHVGNIPVPGEELPLKEEEVAHVNKPPSPRKRAQVTDRGSGPRPRPARENQA